MKWDKLDMAYSEKPPGIQRLSDLDILFGSKTCLCTLAAKIQQINREKVGLFAVVANVAWCVVTCKMHFQHYDYEKLSSPQAILFLCSHIPISVCMCAHTLSMLAKIIHLLHLAQFLHQQPT